MGKMVLVDGFLEGAALFSPFVDSNACIMREGRPPINCHSTRPPKALEIKSSRLGGKHTNLLHSCKEAISFLVYSSTVVTRYLPTILSPKEARLSDSFVALARTGISFLRHFSTSCLPAKQTEVSNTC